MSDKLSRELLRLCRKGSFCSVQPSVDRAEFLCTVHNLLSNGANPNFEYKGSTPLCEAGRSGNVALVERLLTGGALVDLEDAKNSTPLYLAASHGHLDVAVLLLKHGADVNSRNLYGHSPLYTALVNRHEHLAISLIENGAHVNLRHPKNMSWLRDIIVGETRGSLVCSSKPAKLVEVFLEAGASPFYRHNKRFPCFDGSYLYLFDLAGPAEFFSLTKKLAATGYDIRRWGYILDNMSPAVYSDELKDFLQTELQHVANVPSPLQRLCRLRIRHELAFLESSGHIRQKIDQLPIPERMKKFLSLDDL